jgi:hypothetical protein
MSSQGSIHIDGPSSPLEMHSDVVKPNAMEDSRWYVPNFPLLPLPHQHSTRSTGALLLLPMAMEMISLVCVLKCHRFRSPRKSQGAYCVGDVVNHVPKLTAAADIVVAALRTAWTWV